MADKSKKRQRRYDDEEEKPSKEEYAVAKYLRFSLPERDGKLHGMEVKCFMGNAAVDKLMESKWAASKNSDPLFINRASCVSYMLRLLEKGLFHRAEREKRKKDKDKERPKKKKTDKESEKDESATAAADDLRERKGKKDKKSRKEKEGEVNTEETEQKESAEKKGEKKEEKKKKRLKLVMPEKQFFEDGDEVYVWIYDPVHAKTFLIGLLMVLGAIGLCMFPLWPHEVRLGVYYLSLCAAGFVGFILVLVVVRLILFCCVWALTFGKHHFWFLPNLTEDCGFFDSFKPLYKHDVMKSEEPKPKEEKKKKKKRDVEEKDGESNEDVKKTSKSSDKDDSDEFEVIKKEDIDGGGDRKTIADGNNDIEEDEEDDINEENGDTAEEEEKEDKKTK